MIEASARPRSLLVVDDDPTIALMAKMGLGEYGYSIRSVPNGDAAVAAIESAPPDVVLLDVVMQGMSGFEVCRAIRATSTGHGIPIVMATALDDLESIERAYAEGATAFISKPINWPMLRHQLRGILRASGDRMRLAESEERYALAAAGANDGLWDWNITERHVYYSPRWREQLGLRETDVGDQMEDWLARIHPDDELGFRNELNAHLAGDVGKLEIEYRIRDAEDRYRWMLCRALAIRDADGNAYRIAGSQTDISERKLAEERLLHDALHDALTGLPNRRLLLERTAYAIRLAQRRKYQDFAVAVIDLDRFKCINDCLGHAAGDDLLRQIGDRIARHLRSCDTLARIGGDEFAILFDDSGDLADLGRMVGRIQQEIAEPHMLLEREVGCTASIGVTLGSTGYERAEDMLRDAEIAMYHAKGQGKNRHEVFESRMHAEVTARLELEVALRAAVPRQELCIHYQPISRMDDGRIVGFEALLRWLHPERGLLLPGDFLGLAEESGLIVPIGHWMLREATRQLVDWHRRFPQLADTFVSVNLSSVEFGDAELVQHIEDAIVFSGLDRRHLKLEVTESVLIDNTELATRTLDALRASGIKTAIDDFGSGYCSFGYLQRFPFDTLKIDKSFTRRIDREEKSREIVRAIVGLAHNLGLAVVAEGAETGLEVDCLREVGCEFNQGHAYAEPMPPDEIEAFIAHHLDARGPKRSAARPG